MTDSNLNNWQSINNDQSNNDRQAPSSNNNLFQVVAGSEQRNYLQIGGPQPDQSIQQEDDDEDRIQLSQHQRLSSSPSSSESSSSSNDEKWEYESIKEGQDNLQNNQTLIAENKIQDEGDQPNKSQVIRYKYCCKKCKHADKDKDKKACVCVVPRDQRRTHIGNQGCQTCGCNGCSKEDFLFRGQDPEYHPQSKKKENKKKEQRFEARNGCCKGCMKAFSKSGKSCICQVPDQVRKTKLATGGCKICGCTGCNPQDKKVQVRRQKRSKRSRSRSERRRQKRQRRSRSKDRKRNKQRSRSAQIIDTFGMNLHNIDRSIVGSMIINEYQVDPALLGFGIPQRTGSYLFGRN